jgi:uncharacterized protein (TIGR00730 family)
MKIASFSRRVWPSAQNGAKAAKLHLDTPQCRSDAYKLAFQDDEFLLRDELRPVRLQLELLKPELMQQEEGIESTIVVFGSARTPDPEIAGPRLKELEEAVAQDPDNEELQREVKQAGRAVERSRYYGEARKLGRLISRNTDNNKLVVVTGGGPGIMEAANRGADDEGAKSMGMNIVLPHEQAPNPYISPELCFQFHYFAVRKMHLLMRARCLVAFPGGFGTFDELFETLTLIQTKKVDPIPVLLFGKSFWTRVVNFDALVDEGTISPGNLEIFQFVDTAEEAWGVISGHLDIQD